MDDAKRNKIAALLIIAAACFVIFAAVLAARYHVFSKYSYYSGKDWQAGLEKEMCRWYRNGTDTAGVTAVDFDWGYYHVYIYGPMPNEPFDPGKHGYIGFRAWKKGPEAVPAEYPAYIIDAQGVVWINRTPQNIPLPLLLKDFNIGENLDKASGPDTLLEHFKTKEGWSKYGKIQKSSAGDIIIYLNVPR